MQTCFKLTGNLTERDKAAPDLSCVLTRDTPRKDDIPEVKPLKWDLQASEAHVNDLHRLIASVLKDVTGNCCSDSEDLLEIHADQRYEVVLTRDDERDEGILIRVGSTQRRSNEPLRQWWGLSSLACGP